MKVPLSIGDFLARGETVYPNRIAVIDEPDQPAASWGEVTFADFAERCRQFAAGLDSLGVGQGERIAIVSHNSARLLLAIYACGSSGRICVPINFRLKQEEVSYIVEHSGASVLLIDPELADTLADTLASVPASTRCPHRFTLGAESDQALLAADADPRPWQPDEDATATINYTSGTTGRPKGVQMTHRNIWLNAVTFGWTAGVSDDDVYLHTLPMFHCNGWGMPFALFGAGAAQVVLRKVDGPEILRRIAQHGVTYLCGAPAVAKAVLDAAADFPDPIPSGVRMTVAGAPPPTRIIEQLETDLGWEFMQLYGLTETTPYLTINRRRKETDHLPPAERAERLSRQGAPALGIKLQIAESGEVCAQGNHIMHGYWNQPEATAEAIAEGWFRTGDVGFIDEDNYLVLKDRSKDVVISGGENVSSIEVEDCLFSHPAVAEVAVIGVPDEKWGETPKAVVVLAKTASGVAAASSAAGVADVSDAETAAESEGAAASFAATPAAAPITEQDLIDYCRSRMAHFKCPTSVDFCDELPRTATGKVQKYLLRQPYWEGRDTFIN